MKQPDLYERRQEIRRQKTEKLLYLCIIVTYKDTVVVARRMIRCQAAVVMATPAD